VHRDHPALRDVLDRRGVDLHEFIEDKIGEPIVTVEQEFSAKPLLGREAAALGVTAGHAGFVIARRLRPRAGRHGAGDLDHLSAPADELLDVRCGWPEPRRGAGVPRSGRVAFSEAARSPTAPATARPARWPAR